MNPFSTDWAIRLGVKDILESCAFYEELGFSCVSKNAGTALMASSDVLLQLKEKSSEHLALVFFAQEDPESRLYDLGFQVNYSSDEEGRSELGIYSSEALPMIFSEETLPTLDNLEPSLCGRWAELALKCDAFKDSVNFWAALGLRPSAGRPRSYPWAEMALANLKIGLHQKADLKQRFRLYFHSDPKQLRKLPLGSYFKDPSAGVAFLEDPDGHQLWIQYKD